MSTPRARTPRRRPRNPEAKVECAICRRTFRRITPQHLQTHGFTLARYERTFRCDTRPAPPRAPGAALAHSSLAPEHPPTPLLQNPAAAKSSTPLPPDSARHHPALVARLAEELVGNDDLVASLADEVGELIFSGPLRDRLRLALVSLLGSRLHLHARALARLERVGEELDQPWRVEAGGRDGEPTPTGALVSMAHEATGELRDAETTLLKAIKLAVEEARAFRDPLTGGFSSRPAFSGEAETIPVPPELPAQERENIRSLLTLLRREMVARAERVREVVDVTPAGDDTPPSGPLEPPALPPPARAEPLDPALEGFGG